MDLRNRRIWWRFLRKSRNKIIPTIKTKDMPPTAPPIIFPEFLDGLESGVIVLVAVGEVEDEGSGTLVSLGRKMAAIKALKAAV